MAFTAGLGVVGLGLAAAGQVQPLQHVSAQGLGPGGGGGHGGGDGGGDGGWQNGGDGGWQNGGDGGWQNGQGQNQQH